MVKSAEKANFSFFVPCLNFREERRWLDWIRLAGHTLETPNLDRSSSPMKINYKDCADYLDCFCLLLP